MIFSNRQEASCYLVFEDRDSIVSDNVCSYFLHGVNGLEICCLAWRDLSGDIDVLWAFVCDVVFKPETAALFERVVLQCVIS